MYSTNFNISERKINFHNAQNALEPQNIKSLKSSSFCNPSEHYINKQLMSFQGIVNPVTYQPPAFNNIEKLFSPNLEKGGEKKRSKKENSSNENQFVIYLENVII